MRKENPIIIINFIVYVALMIGLAVCLNIQNMYGLIGIGFAGLFYFLTLFITLWLWKREDEKKWLKYIAWNVRNILALYHQTNKR